MGARALPQHTFHVIVVGAGLSGICCARELVLNKNIPPQKVLLLEASNRPGGRVRTATHFPHIELGATWFHGIFANAAFNLAKRNNLLFEPTLHDGSAACNAVSASHFTQCVTESDDEHEHEHEECEMESEPPDIGEYILGAQDGIYLNKDGSANTLSKYIAQKVLRAYARAERMLLAAAEPTAITGALSKRDISKREFIRAKLREHFETEPVPEHFHALFQARDGLESVIDGTPGNTSEQSAVRAGDYVELDGEHVRLHGGLSLLVHSLLKDCADVTVYFEARVVNVRVQNEGVHVKLLDGRAFFTECVVWTPSVNVTKHAVSNGVFVPQLPPRKLHALQFTGMAPIAQLHAVLACELQTATEGHTLPVLWQVHDLYAEADFERDAFTHWQHGVHYVYYQGCRRRGNISNDENARADENRCASSFPTVSFWLSGRAAAEMEACSEEILQRDTEILLRTIYAGESDNVHVKEIVKSCWSVDENIRGGYSFPKVNAPKHRVEQLASPVLVQDNIPRLCFAGEATHEKFFSTMHGAVESGQREAARCAAYLNTLRKRE